MTMFRIIGATVAAAALLATAACAGQTSTSNAAAPSANEGGNSMGAPTISATGTGIVTGIPDIAYLTLGVQTRAETAGAALKSNNTSAQELIKALQNAGVAEKDLQTSQMSVWPTYNNNGTEITGYEVSNSVIATVRDIDAASDIIDSVQKAVGDAIRLDAVSFGFDDDSELLSDARAKAVTQALKQAEELAAAAGRTAGDIISITEGAPLGDTPVMRAYAAADSADAGGPPLMAGNQQLAVTVRVVVALS